MFSEYVKHGWKLCAIPRGTKGPREKGWNLPENAISSPVEADMIEGAGLCHSLSGTCALDIDDLAATSKFFEEHLISLERLLAAWDRVQISSGRPNRAKLLYRLPEPLYTIKPAGGSFELRSMARTGATVQDVLPPTVHPDTGKPYVWVGDWRQLPEIPASLLELWKSLLAVEPSSVAPATTGRLTELSDLLSRRSSSCGYDEWIKAGMACHHESGGDNEGFALWDEWSAASDKYPGVAVLRSHWASFGRSGTPITADSLRKNDIASASEFDEVIEDGQDWLAPAEPEEKVEYRWWEAHLFCDRPEPDWLIESALPSSGLGTFWGQPSGGKTFLALDTALSVALGRSWRGCKVRQGSVLYLAAEDDAGVATRLKVGMAAHGVNRAPIRLLPASPVFTSKRQTKALLDSIRPLGPQAMVFVDTLSAVVPGSDQNSSKDMSQAIHFSREIQRITGGLVILVHHEGKTAGRGPMGWSGLHGAFDVEWKVTNQEDYREMEVTKLKNAPIGNMYKFNLLPIGKSCIVEWL